MMDHLHQPYLTCLADAGIRPKRWTMYFLLTFMPTTLAETLAKLTEVRFPLFPTRPTFSQNVSRLTALG
jgi:hypothetical protein